LAFWAELSDDVRFSSAVADLNKKPYLWPSALLWGSKADRTKVEQIARERPPDSPLINFLFFNMMTRIMKPAKPWRANLLRHDIIRIKAFPPARLSDINQLLSDHLCLLSRVAAIKNDELTDILAAWRGWSEVFGWAPFLVHLLNRIIGKTAHILVPQDTRNLFQSVGYLMPLIVIPDVNTIETIFDTVIELVDGDLRGTTAAIGLAEFAVVVISTCPNGWEHHFTRMCEYAVRVLEEDQGIERPRGFFGRSFLKSCLSAPLLREKVVDQAFNILSKVKDWQAIVDIFIVQHLISMSPR
jgi:hypothetical protein